MWHELLEERVGKLETEQVRQGERLGRMEADLAKTSAGVERLLERDARRPEPIGLKAASAAVGALISVAVIVWWLIGHSPSVLDLDKRLSRLDDPDVGRVPRLEREAGWAPRIIKN